MKTGIQKLMAILALISIALSSGFLIIVIQLIAWTSMFSEYNQYASASDSLKLTFSGNEICGICLVADEIQEDMDDTLLSFHNSNTPLLISLPTEQAQIKVPQITRIPFSKYPQESFEAIPPTLSTPPPRVFAT